MGLSTAIKLLEAGYKVDIVARDLPGDPLSIEYTSPWAVRLRASSSESNTMGKLTVTSPRKGSAPRQCSHRSRHATAWSVPRSLSRLAPSRAS